MAEIVATNENTLNAELEVDAQSQVSPTVDLSGVGQAVQVAEYKTSVPTYEAYKISELSSKTPSIPKVSQTLNKTVLSLDVETTGLNPWEYKLIVCSVWNLNEPKANMRTFAGWDEEALCVEMFKYIAEQNADVILAFNAKFECRCFITRAMLYHIKAPWIWSVEWHDMLTMLEGGWKNGLSGTMPAGSEENWLKFFFGEVKPYTIDECFQGIREGRLDEMIVRNRTCVQGQGDMYLLYNWAQASEEDKVEERKPSTARIDEMTEEGTVLEKCEVCEAVNEVTNMNDPGQCWRCHANLPVPTSKTIIREVAREIDWSLVGLSGDALKAAQKAGKDNKKFIQEEVGEGGDVGKSSMARLIEVGSAPHTST